MNPSDALLAARQERPSVTEVAATDPARCFPQCALSVVRKPKYRSSPAKADQYIAASATIKSERTDNAGFTPTSQYKDISGLYQ
jgi:hypothetical protein